MSSVSCADGVLSFAQDHALTIRNIRAVHELILAAFAKDNVCLALPEDVDVDLSFIQLIESARRHAESQGKTIRLAKPAGGNVRRVLERGGFFAPSAPDAGRFWLHEEAA